MSNDDEGVPVEQKAQFALLANPATYAQTGPVERIDTHISAIFLVKDRVYKLKRSIHLPFLDFSTPEKRREYCLAEIEANRHAAPGLYLGVEPIVQKADGELALGGEGKAIDWVVVMRRFEQDGLYDHLAESGSLNEKDALALAEAASASHRRATPDSKWGGAGGMLSTESTNAACFASLTPEPFDKQKTDALTRKTGALIEKLAPLLERRRKDGHVRICHGDLHLGNICKIEGRPVLFDAIEFNDNFSHIDVLYDLAFLLMDLLARSMPSLANRVFNRYFELENEIDGLAVMPLFLSLRAAVRAHVLGETARSSGHPELVAPARDYLDQALALLEPTPPVLLAVGGLSGSGKSRLGRNVAPFVGCAPGALIVRTDVMRKRMMGVAPEVRLTPEAYQPDVTRQTYQTMLEHCAKAIECGHSAIADAVFARPKEREMAENLASSLGVPFIGFWTETDRATMEARVRERKNDASDATVAVVERQSHYDLGEMNWNRIDTSGAKEETMKKALAILGL